MRNTTMLLLFTGLLLIAGLTLWPRGKGWAITDGWVVEYEIEVPAYYGFDFFASGVQGVETPQSRLEKLVTQWSTDHADLAPLPGVELARLSIGQPMPEVSPSGQVDNFFVHRAQASLLFMSEDAELLNELLDLLRDPGAGLPPLNGEIRKYNKSWIVQAKNPKLYEPRTFTVDGREFHFPQDFPGDVADSQLAGQLPDPAEKHQRSSMLYYNLLTESERQLTGAGLLTRLDFRDGRLSVTTLHDDERFRQLALAPDLRLGLQMGGTYSADGTPKAPESEEFYLDALYQVLRERSSNHEEDYESLQVWGLEYLLFPQERFEPGQPAENYRVTDADRKHALAMAERYRAAFEAAFPGYADLRLEDGSRAVSVGGGGQLESARLGAPINEQPRYSLSLTLRGPKVEEAAKIKAVLDTVEPGATSFSWRLRDETMRKTGH